MTHSPVLEPPRLDVADEPSMRIRGTWPDSVYVMKVGSRSGMDLYFCMDVTLPGPDSMTVGVLTACASADDITSLAAQWGMEGDVVTKTLEECLEIAKERPRLSGVGLYSLSGMIDIVWVR